MSADSEALSAVCEGRGRAKRLLLALEPARRREVLATALAGTDPEAQPAESRRGLFAGRLLLATGCTDLARVLSARIESDSLDEPGRAFLLGVLAELAERRIGLAPFPFLRLARADVGLTARIEALAVLAALGDDDALASAVASTLEALDDPFDAREWGAALVRGGLRELPRLRGLLGAPDPMHRLAAAFGISAIVEDRLTDRPGHLETLADLLAFDPDPLVRAHALELREGSPLPDPNEVVVRVLTDVATHPFLDAWHWSLAADSLRPADLQAVLQAIDGSREASPLGVPNLLARSEHPLAIPILKGRLCTAPPEQQEVLLEALDSRGAELEPELLDRLAGPDAPPRLALLRARAGREGSLPALVEALADGALGPEDFESPRDDLLLQALAPAALEAMARPDRGVQARLLALLRPVVPASRLPEPDPSWLAHPDRDVAREAAVGLVVRDGPGDRGRVERWLGESECDQRAALLESLARLPAARGLAGLRGLGADPEPHVRRAWIQLLGRLPAAAAPAEWLTEALDDPCGSNRAEALAACRARGLAVPRDGIEELLADSCEEAREAAARALAALDGPAALGPLEAARADEPIPWVREHLAELLDELRTDAGERRAKTK